MKKFILTTGLLVLANILFCQTNNADYLDFFGKKYYLSDTITSFGPKFKLYIQPQKKTFTYKLCGKQLLNEKYEIIKYKDVPNDMIVKTFLSFLDCKDFDNVVDSIKIQDLNKDMDFKIVKEKKNYKILGYKIFADSIDYEIEYKNTSDRFCGKNWNVLTDNDPNYAKQMFISTIKDMKNCSELILKDICFFDSKKGYIYYLDIDILLRQ